MDYFLPSSVKSRLLRFALAKTGFLDTDALDLDKLNFSLGRNTNAEFRDVGLRIEKITALLQLPPSIRLLAARAVLIRVSIASDLGITAEIDGIEVRARIDELDLQKKDERHPESLRTPSHRKTARRLLYPSAQDPGGQSSTSHHDGETSRVSTARDLAKSFLDEEPLEERQELAANLISQSRSIDDSVMSETSSDELGTGNGIGLPAFLTGLIQGVMDRLQIKIRNVNLRCDANIHPKGNDSNSPSLPISLVLSVATIDVFPITPQDAPPGAPATTSNVYTGRRHILIAGINFDMLCEATKSDQFSSSPLSPSTSSKSQEVSPSVPSNGREANPGGANPTTTPPLDASIITLPSMNAGETVELAGLLPTTPTQEQPLLCVASPTASTASTGTTARSRFADADEENDGASPRDTDEYDIQAGEDSHSYTSRRSQSSSDPDQAMYPTMEESQILYASIADFQSSHGSGSVSAPGDMQQPFPSTYLPAGDDQSGDKGRTDSDKHYSPSQVQPHDEGHARSGLDSAQSPSETDDAMTHSVLMGESMYLSATSNDLTPSIHDVRLSEASHTASEYFPPSPEYRRAPGYFPDESYIEHLARSTATVRSTGDGENEPLDKASTPKVSELTKPTLQPHLSSQSQLRKQMLTLDTVSIWLPDADQSATRGGDISQSIMLEPSLQSSMSASMFSPDMPGTFSNYADMGASRRFQASFMSEHIPTSGTGATAPSVAGGLDIDIGQVNLQSDTPTLQILFQVTQMAVPDSPNAGPTDLERKIDSPTKQSSIPQLTLRLKAVRLALIDHMPEILVTSDADTPLVGLDQPTALVRLSSRDVSLGLNPRKSKLDITFGIRRLTVGTGTKDIISFIKSSHGQHDKSPDILIKIQMSEAILEKRPVTDIRAWLRPIYIDLDLPAIDEALGSFGGLSGVMEMSASVLSSGADAVATPSSPPRRGVRFQEDIKPIANVDTSPEIKLNVAFQGANVAIRSHSCALELQSSIIKLSVRSNYSMVTMGNIKLAESLTAGQSNASRFIVQLKDVKLQYLASPENIDLERLVSLITPSKDKYENDDDILLDTLLRQRRKGAVLRVRLGSVRGDVNSWAFIADLQTLADDLGKLSAVTKYLPEDDRPGLLVLPRVIDSHFRLPINDNFGMLEVSLRDIQAAQIGLPALVAVAIGSVRAGPLNGRNIVHELRPAEQLPMVMMRMVGDEVEPTAKIKLFNCCLEYSVDSLVALVGSDSALQTEKVVSDLANSIFNVATSEERPPSSSPGHQSEEPAQAVKKVALDVLLHDCAVGLKPRESTAKGVLVLTDTRLNTVIPPDDQFTATLELRKASLHVIDREVEKAVANELVPRSSFGTDRLSAHLTFLGYVSVSSIMSAKAILSITEDGTTSERYVDLELRDELFVLETCADSTQTLISILNGLAPPTAPSNAPQFRTEVMSVGDLMASFSGDAFEKPSAAPSTLFDVDEEPPLSAMDALLQESAMTDSVYLPDGFEQGEEQAWSSDGGSVTSLLDEDEGFEFMDTPNKKRLNDDALEKDIQRQSLPQGCQHTKPLSSTLLEPSLTRKECNEAQNPRVLGAAYRFATPATPFPSNKMAFRNGLSPFQVRVRDVHIIWNLYDGYDWELTRTTIAEAVEEVEQRLEQRKQRRRRSTEPEEEEESVIGDCLFNSIYIGVANTRDAGDLRQQISRGIDDMASESESYATSGNSRPTQYSANRQSRPPFRSRKRLRLMRSKAHKIAFELKGVSLDFIIHPLDSGEVQSSVDVRIKDFEIFDNVPTSTWRKFLTYHHDEDNMREMLKPMIHLELLNVRPVPDLAATEINIRVSILPLRLHVDQDALDFITRFFEFKPEASATLPATDPPFIQRIEVNTVNMCLDYKPKKVDYAGIRSGHTGEFKNFVILDAANIKLKHAIVYGIKGFETLHPTLSDIWTPDVIRNQLPGVLAGLGPLRPLVSLGAGFRDVVAIPVREYRKDGRLFRSVQKGAFHFAKTTTAELARLGSKVATGTHAALSGFEEALLGTDSRAEEGEDYEERRLVSNYADQPLGVLQGLRSARRHFERDLLTTRDAIIAVQGEVVDAGSATGVARAVAKYAPTIVLRPVIGASRAVGQTFMGVTNQVDSANVRRNEDKYKPR